MGGWSNTWAFYHKGGRARRWGGRGGPGVHAGRPTPGLTNYDWEHANKSPRLVPKAFFSLSSSSLLASRDCI
jgi:hypothetical protein